VQNKQQNNGVEFEDSTLREKTKRDVLVSPALRDPVGHESSDRQGGRNGCAFKVLGLAGLILREYGNSHVEPGEAGQTTKNKEGEEDMVNRGSDTKSECGRGRSEAKGNLVARRS
jgi:hypothetical protein